MSRQATSPPGPAEATPTDAQKKDCKLSHTQVKLFQVNLHLKFFLQRHLYSSLHHGAVQGGFYLGSKQRFQLEIFQLREEVQRQGNLLISEIVI